MVEIENKMSALLRKLETRRWSEGLQGEVGKPHLLVWRGKSESLSAR